MLKSLQALMAAEFEQTRLGSASATPCGQITGTGL